MIPNLRDFQIAVLFSLGSGKNIQIEDLYTYIIENFDIEYETSVVKPILKRTPAYECIIGNILDIMVKLEDAETTEDGQFIRLTKKGLKNMDKHEHEISARLQVIFKSNCFKRLSKDDIEKAYKEIKEVEDSLYNIDCQ